MKLLLTVAAVAAVLSHRYTVALAEHCVKSDHPLPCEPDQTPVETPPGSKCWMCESFKKSCPKGYFLKDDVCCPTGRHFPSEKSNCNSDQALDQDLSGCWKCSPCTARFPRVGAPLLSWWQGSKLSIRRSLLPIRCEGVLCRLHSSKLALESTKADSEIIKWSTSKEFPEQPGTCCMKGVGIYGRG